MNWTALADTAWTGSIADTHRAMRREWLVAMILANKTATWRNLGIDQDLRDKLVAGWAIYTAIRAQDARSAREARERWNYRRFVELGRLWTRWEFSVQQAIDHLNSDLSTRAMVMQIIDAHHPDPEWHRKFDSMCKYGEVIFTSFDAPEDVRAWAGEGRRLMEKYK